MFLAVLSPFSVEVDVRHFDTLEKHTVHMSTHRRSAAPGIVERTIHRATNPDQCSALHFTTCEEAGSTRVPF